MQWPGTAVWLHICVAPAGTEERHAREAAAAEAQRLEALLGVLGRMSASGMTMRDWGSGRMDPWGTGTSEAWHRKVGTGKQGHREAGAHERGLG